MDYSSSHHLVSTPERLHWLSSRAVTIITISHAVPKVTLLVVFRYLLWFSKALPWIRKLSVFENQPHDNPGPQSIPCEKLIREKGLWSLFLKEKKAGTGRNVLFFLSSFVWIWTRMHSPWNMELTIDVKKCMRIWLQERTVWSHSHYQS